LVELHFLLGGVIAEGDKHRCRSINANNVVGPTSALCHRYGHRSTNCAVASSVRREVKLRVESNGEVSGEGCPEPLSFSSALPMFLYTDALTQFPTMLLYSRFQQSLL